MVESLSHFPRRAYWMGLFVTYAFRFFAYGVLWVTSDILRSRSFPFPHASFLFAAYALAALTAPLIVPTVAGFLGAFYWRHSPHTNITPLFVCSALLTVASCVAPGTPLFVTTGYPLANEVIVFLGLYCLLDVGLCVSGAVRGREFWNGRMARQMLGDFSTLDERG